MEDIKNANPDNSARPDGEQYKLDDARRVKVLSPGMLVAKRFIRNKLAVTGLIILAAMFLFAFVGALFSPYSQSQMFKKYDIIMGEFASATYNTELRYTVSEGAEFNNVARSAMALAISRGESSFTAGGTLYQILQAGEDFYSVFEGEPVMNVESLKALNAFSEIEGGLKLTPELEAAFNAALKANETAFEYAGETYAIVKTGTRSYSICIPHTVAVASKLAYDAYEETELAVINSAQFRYDSELAIQAGDAGFTSDGTDYTVAYDDGTVIYKNGEPYAATSSILIDTIMQDVFVSVELKTAIRDAIADGRTKFSITGESGETLDYEIYRTNATFKIKGEAEKELIDDYASPSRKHLMGTDANGMDILTRLMYGGRVSLMIGFVVVFIEIFLGVLIGGFSGYFGGIVDTCLMRFVDLFNCIPYWPMMIIIGSLMDAFKVESRYRIWLLMILLGVMGWTGIARVVRGQILSLREQDFMLAAEATGISVSRRIFKHLVPNVMPLLIVQATMSLGSIIITEATLSFLGLGVKFPLASWGSIINAATNIYVMTNFWFVWIPAGVLIFLTVLGFNFVGDGLRDAFDPKMKR